MALHAGRPASVTLSRFEGPTSLGAGGARVPLREARVVRADHGVRVALGPGGPEVDLVEHLLSAGAAPGRGAGARRAGAGGEVPLLDGGARAFSDALLSLGVPPSGPLLEVRRAFEARVGESRYELSPGAGRRVAVSIAFDHPRIGAQSARWEGDGPDFARRVAPARTFGFLRDHPELARAGRARAVDLDAVVVFDDEGPVPGCRLRAPDEPALHKLLDLIGDLALHGGPPRGSVRAHRPGHGATHEVLRRGLLEGALGPAS